MIKKNLNRVPLEQVYNLRSFGGYEVDAGYEVDNGKKKGVSRHGVFYRSGGVIDPSKNDVDIIINDLNIRTIFDLRGEVERQESPNYFNDSPIIKVINVDLFVELDDRIMKDLKEVHKDENNMALIYVAMVESAKEKIKFLIDEMADSIEKGGVLYHCSAGKDRAGVTSMFLQAITGFAKEDIIADYSISTEILAEHGSHFIHPSNPDYIEFLLTHLEKKYGGIVSYLETIGVKEESFKKIRNSMIKYDKDFKNQREKDLTLRRLNLNSINNFRSVGDYPLGGNKITNHGAYYRGGLPHEIEENDLKRIKDLNIKTIIDLRSTQELKKHPNGFLADDFFNVVNIDLMAEMDPSELLDEKTKENHKDILSKGLRASGSELKKIFDSADNLMGRMYVYLLDKKPELIKKTLDAIAEGFSQGGVLVHCTAGKDRTGTISMLINMMVGMETKDIISDYQVSETYINMGEADLALSRPEYIKHAIEYMENQRGGSLAYLKEIGFSDENRNLIIDKLVFD